MEYDIYRGARLERLALTAIERDDRRFELAWPARQQPPRDRVGRATAEVPLWVQEIAGGRYRLVRGFSRFDSLRELGAESFPALVFAEDCPSLELFRARLSGRSEELSAVEASRALKSLEALDGAEQSVLTGFLPLLGQPATEGAFSSLRALANLEEPLARWCASQKAPLPECVVLAGLPRESQRGLLVLLRALNPGGNLLRRWLGFLTSISRRSGQTLEDILADSRITDILLDAQTARSAGRELVSRRLTELRYPESTALRQRFAETVKSLGLPEGVKVEPPEALEGDRLRISFEPGTTEAWSGAAAALARAAQGPAAGELFRLLGAPEPENR
ncbi:hypothetical protein LLH00_07790 [bacterium]|nr:hypothetical protein [bacterium]